jgi:hypothetical protein
MPDIKDNIARLGDAGLIQAGTLDADDRQIIGQLTEQEVTQLILIARRLYAADPSLVKVVNLRSGLPRICIPL